MRDLLGMLCRSVVALWLFVGGMWDAWSQETDSMVSRALPEVEVSGESRLGVMRSGAPVQEFRRGEWEALGVAELSEVVKRFAGAQVKDYGGLGGLKTVSVRSLGVQHTAASYDGITLTDAQSGQIDLGRFSLDNVESVALSIGPSGELYQTARLMASAGALRITTRRALTDSLPFSLEAQVKGGSFGMFAPSLRSAQRLGGGLSASLDADYLTAAGQYPYTFVNGDLVTHEKRRNSDICGLRTEVNLFGDWAKAGQLHLKGYAYASERGLPGAVILYNDYHKERLGNRNTFVQGVYERPLTARLTLKALAKADYAYTRYRDYHSKYVGGEQTDVYTQREYYGSVVAGYNVAAGAQGWSFSLAEDIFRNTLDATTPLCAFPRRLTSLTAVAAQYLSSRLTLGAALLYASIAESVASGGAAGDNLSRLSPSVSLSCRLVDRLRLRVSYKDGYRVPTFNDLYYDRTGSKDLRPERAAQYNVGLTWSGTSDRLRLVYLSLTADAYCNRVKDKIVALPTLFIWRMLNMGTVDIKGLDVCLAARFRLPAEIAAQVDGTYSLQNALDVTDQTSKTYRHHIPYTPQHTGTLSLTVERRRLTLGWLLSATGERYALPQNIAANRMDGYAEQQLSLARSFTVAKHATLRLQMEILNLTNVSYDIIRYYPMPGRSFRLSAKFNFNNN